MSANENVFGGFSGIFGDQDGHGGHDMLDEQLGSVATTDPNAPTGMDNELSIEDIVAMQKAANGEEDLPPAPVTTKKEVASKIDKGEEEDAVTPEKENTDNLDTDVDADPSTDPEDFIEDEAVVVSSIYGVLANKLGIDVDEEDTPDSFDGMVDKLQDIVKTNSKPTYASDQMRDLDAFVHNGGKLEDFFTGTKDYIVSAEDLENDSGQKKILRQYLKHNNFNDEAINKKISDYEMAGLLASESEDAYGQLEVIKANQQKELLDAQSKAASDYEASQQAIYENVVTTIEDLKEINGVNISLNDKKELVNYLFEPTKSGLTKWQEDGKQVENIVLAAYLMKHGPSLIDTAKRKGKSEAYATFKAGLRSPKSPKGKTVTYNKSSDYEEGLSTISDGVNKLFGGPSE